MNAAVLSTRRRSVVGLVLCASLGASMFVVSMRSRSGAQDVNLGNEYINRARSAALTYDFGGEIEVVWSGVDGQQRTHMSVRSEDGVLSLGDDEQVVIQGPVRFTRGDSGWATLWAKAAERPVRSAAEKWELSVRGGPVIAGRATREVAATNREEGRLRERRYFDAITGLLLRREQFDDTGRRVRYVTYTSITLPPQVPPGSAPKVPTSTAAREPRTMTEIPSGVDIPLGVGDGFALNGAYRRPDGTIQLFYSDGLLSVSVFQQEGTLDRDALDPGGVDRVIDGHFARQYDVPMGTVLVWEREGKVFTTVSDTSYDELASIVGSFGGKSGFTQRALDFVLGPFGW